MIKKVELRKFTLSLRDAKDLAFASPEMIYRANPCVGVFKSEESFVNYLIRYQVPNYGSSAYVGFNDRVLAIIDEDELQTAKEFQDMASIPRREDIVKKLERSESSELQAVSDSVASVLINAKSLPVHFSGSGLGSTEGVRRSIIQRLKDAGWNVREIDEQQGKDTKWSVS